MANDKHKDYVRYAAHCLDMVSETKDQAARAINREMAGEWLKLADAILHHLTRSNKGRLKLADRGQHREATGLTRR